MRLAIKVLCGTPLLVALALLRSTYKQAIPFRKPLTASEREELIRRRMSLGVFDFKCYQVAGYDVVDRMRLLMGVVIVAWVVFFVGLIV